MFNIPMYNKGTGLDSYTGVRMTGTIRDVVNVLQEKGYGLGGWMSPVVRAGLEAFFLDHDDLGLDTMSAEELEAMIDNIILNGDLSSLGVGMHLYDMSDGTTPPPEEEDPESGEETIYITESRITRRKNLNDSALSVSETLGAHEFKWDIAAFSSSILSCSGCHCSSKSITDKTNTINVEQSVNNKEEDGVLDKWSYVTTGSSNSTNKFVKTWSSRTTGSQHYTFDGVGYCIVVIRKDDKVDLIDYRANANAGTIDGISNRVVNTNNSASNGRSSNGTYGYDVSLTFEPNEGKWGYEKETVYTHTDYHGYTDTSGHHHSSSSRTETVETEFNTSTAVDMIVHVIWDVYAGTPDGGTTDTTSSGLTQHLTGTHMESWLEIPMENGETSFHPYIKMMYDTNLVTNSQVYVAGQYLRTIQPNEYVGVSFDLSKNTGNKVVNSSGTSNNLLVNWR